MQQYPVICYCDFFGFLCCAAFLVAAVTWTHRGTAGISTNKILWIARRMWSRETQIMARIQLLTGLAGLSGNSPPSTAGISGKDITYSKPQLVTTAIEQIMRKAGSQAPIWATRAGVGRRWMWTSLKASTRSSATLLRNAQSDAVG